MNEPTLDELLPLVLRDAGWIMAGGSAQFREGALRDLQASLRVVRQHAGDQKLLDATKELSDLATVFAANKTPTTSDTMNLRGSIEHFETAMKAYLKTARRR